MAAMARPGMALSSVRMALSRGALRRSSADIYRLHADFVGRMDAGEARRLIALRDRLDRLAAKGEKVVSDVFPGR